MGDARSFVLKTYMRLLSGYPIWFDTFNSHLIVGSQWIQFYDVVQSVGVIGSRRKWDTVSPTPIRLRHQLVVYRDILDGCVKSSANLEKRCDGHGILIWIEVTR